MDDGDGFIVAVISWAVRAAARVIEWAIRLVFLLMRLGLTGLGRLSRNLAAKRGRGLANLEIRSDILQAVSELEYSARRRFTGAVGGTTTEGRFLVDLSKLLPSEEEVLTVRAGYTGPTLKVTMATSHGILAVTSLRVIFLGTRGGVDLSGESIDSALCGSMNVELGTSDLVVRARGNEIRFGFWESGSASDLADAIMALRSLRPDDVVNQASPTPMPHGTDASVPQATPTARHGRTHLSPDGRHWWDGAGWRPVDLPEPLSTPARAHAHVSPDGRYWWDGSTWRAVADSTPVESEGPLRDAVVLEPSRSQE